MAPFHADTSSLYHPTPYVNLYPNIQLTSGGTWGGGYPVSNPGPKATVLTPEPESKPSVFNRAKEWLGQKFPSPAEVEYPPMAGAAPEAETKRTVEHKKKITLTRTVGVSRPTVKDGAETHSGSVELVRTIEGDKLEMETIGIKVQPNGGSYVEIPWRDLLGAVEELRDSVLEDKV